jgi:ribosomal protein S4
MEIFNEKELQNFLGMGRPQKECYKKVEIYEWNLEEDQKVQIRVDNTENTPIVLLFLTSEVQLDRRIAVIEELNGALNKNGLNWITKRLDKNIHTYGWGRRPKTFCVLVMDEILDHTRSEIFLD